MADRDLIYRHNGRQYRESDMKGRHFPVTAHGERQAVDVFDDEDSFRGWAKREGLFETVERLDRKAHEAARERGLDEERHAESLRSKSKDIERKLKRLADELGVDLGSAGEADWDRLLRRATIDTDKPVFDPLVIWEHINFGGAWMPVEATLPDLRWFGFNDRLSSWWIGGAGVFFEHIWYGGARYYTFGVPAASFPWIGHEWNDRVSSIALV